MTPKIIVAPTEEPISITAARAHLASDEEGDSDGFEDAMIIGFIAAAREYCADFLGLSLAECTLEVALDAFPTVVADGTTDIELPMGPVNSIESIGLSEVTDGTDSDGVIEDGLFVLDDYSQPSRLVPVDGWPSASGTNSIKIRYRAGYAAAENTDGVQVLPAVFKQAILLMLAHFYANREATAERAISTVPLGVEALLRPHRVRVAMA